jgi:hypothetical protein
VHYGVFQDLKSFLALSNFFDITHLQLAVFGAFDHRQFLVMTFLARHGQIFENGCQREYNFIQSWDTL